MKNIVQGSPGCILISKNTIVSIRTVSKKLDNISCLNLETTGNCIRSVVIRSKPCL